MKKKIKQQTKKIIITAMTLLLILSMAGCGKQTSPTTNDVFAHVIFYGCNNLELMKEYVEADKARANTLIYDKTSKKKVSPLYLVQADNYDPRFAAYLLQQGANPNVAYGETTLLMCISGADPYSSGGPEFGKLLIQQGADANAKDNAGLTALDYAFDSDIDYVNYLIANGAKVSNKTLNLLSEKKADMRSNDRYLVVKMIFQLAKKQGINDNQDPIFEAAALGETNTVLTLAKKQGNHNPSDFPFYVAAWCKPAALNYFINHGFDPNRVDANGNDLLWIAANTGNLDMVKYLVGKGASLDFHSYNPLGTDPLKIAVINNHYAVVKYLLERGAKFNINKQTGYDGLGDDANRRPLDSLQGAAMNGNIQMIKLLEKYDYPFSATTLYRAMKMAIDYNQLHVLNYFLKNGADPDYVDTQHGDHNTLLDVCALYGTIDSLKLLEQYGATIKTSQSAAIADAAGKGNDQMVKQLLNTGMDSNAQLVYSDGSRSTLALEAACSHGYFDIVKLLVDHGANINGKHIEYNLVLGQAAYSSHILQYLVDHGAKVNVQDKDDGNTPLMLAASMHRDKNVEILLKAGADTSLKNKKGQTALDIAKADKQPDKNIIKMLEGN